MLLARSFAPFARPAGVADEGVAGHVLEHLRQFDAIRDRQEQRENIRPPDDRHGLAAGQPEHFVD
jgi:hypothetical protein